MTQHLKAPGMPDPAKPAKPAPDATRRRPTAYGPTYNLILEMSVGNPLLTPEQIAALVNRNMTVVRGLMQSDEFLERRAALLLERYGDKIQNVRHKLLDVAGTILNALNDKMQDADTSAALVLEAAKWIAPFVQAPVYDPNAKHQVPTTNNTLNLIVPPEVLSEARAKQAAHARSIPIPEHPNTIEHKPAGPTPLPALPSPKERTPL